MTVGGGDSRAGLLSSARVSSVDAQFASVGLRRGRRGLLNLTGKEFQYQSNEVYCSNGLLLLIQIMLCS